MYRLQSGAVLNPLFDSPGPCGIRGGAPTDSLAKTSIMSPGSGVAVRVSVPHYLKPLGSGDARAERGLWAWTGGEGSLLKGR